MARSGSSNEILISEYATYLTSLRVVVNEKLAVLRNEIMQVEGRRQRECESVDHSLYFIIQNINFYY